MKKINVVVTGAGSAVGQGILKCLSKLKKKINLIPADISTLNAGLYFLKKSIIIPKVESYDAKKKIISIIKKNKINALFLGSEYEIEFFSKYKNEIEYITKSKIFVSNLRTVQIGNDKFKTYSFLKRNNFLVPKTILLKKNLLDRIVKEINFPCIIKPRKGTSSRGVQVISSQSDLKKQELFKKKNYIIQNFSGKNQKKEYSAGIFVDNNKNLFGPIILRREIKNGTSWISEVIDNKKFYFYLRKVAMQLDICGSINFQFFERDGLPEIFEINPRISGTCSVRAYFGFNEPLMFINNYLKKKPITHPIIKKGICFRFNQELFIENANFKSLNEKKNINAKIKKWF